jgi:transcriptional regulator with XRE-family HTH domain
MPDSTSEKEEIARRIRALRRSRGISLQQLAQATEISPGYLSEVERGHSEISGLKLARVAEHLGVSTDHLLAGRPEASSSSTIQIPQGLSEAAKVLELSYGATLRLLAGKESLVARRSGAREREWTKDDWIDFYNKVKAFL